MHPGGMANECSMNRMILGDMMNAIEVRDLHISYKTIKAKSIKQTLFSLKKSSTDKFEAVRGVSFNIKKGEIVGLIGKNGSGKSTLLRSIAGIFSPDSGVIDTNGNNVSLLSIGVGFQNELTGRDNIFLSGLLMGFSKEQIQEKYEEIVRFSELGNFINAPVKTYSSGMHSKLAFSITAILETDIMLIDEILSVGDRKFKKKSYAKMQELISHEDRTVMIVSHSSDTIKKLCNRVIWLNDGLIVADGETGETLRQYNEYMDYQEALMAKADKVYWYNKVEVKKNQILLYPTYGRYCDDIRYLCKYMLQHCPDWDLVWVKRRENEKIGIRAPKLKVVLEKTPEFYRAVYSSKIILDDGMNLVKEDIKKHAEQRVYKILKGSLGMKDVTGEKISQRKKERSARLVDYCVSNSAFETEVYHSSFWKDKQIVESGHPRNDLLFAEEPVKRELREKVRAYYKIPEGNRIVLYAPTYREKTMEQGEWETMDFAMLREALSKRFGWEVSILVRAHRKDKGKWAEIEKAEGVVNAGGYSEITELMVAADVGITDYSSWIFDFLFLEKPGFLYAPNAKEYQEQRGFYYPLEETPFPVAGDMKSLAENIAAFDEEAYQKKAKGFLGEKGCMEKGNACEALAEHFRQQMG